MLIENVNTYKLHNELCKAGIFPFPVFDNDGVADMTFPKDTDMILVQQIIDAHDPTPLPQSLSEIDILGQQVVEKDLQIIDLNETTNMLSQQLVEKDIQLLDIQSTNDMLGQNLVSLELRIMKLEMGGM